MIGQIYFPKEMNGEIGAYNLEDETIQYLNQGISGADPVSPAIWVAPSF